MHRRRARRAEGAGERRCRPAVAARYVAEISIPEASGRTRASALVSVRNGRVAYVRDPLPPSKPRVLLLVRGSRVRAVSVWRVRAASGSGCFVQREPAGPLSCGGAIERPGSSWPDRKRSIPRGSRGSSPRPRLACLTLRFLDGRRFDRREVDLC